MSGTRGNRIWQWAVLLLVLCNAGLVATLWLKPSHEGPPRGGGPRDFVISSLKFTDVQVKKYDVLIADHQQQMHRLHDDIQVKKTALFDRLKTGGNYVGNANPFVDSLTTQIGMLQRQIEGVTYYHFAKVRELCTEQQKAEFDRIIGDVVRRMGPGRPGPAGPREQGPPDGPPPGDQGGQGPPPPRH